MNSSHILRKFRVWDRKQNRMFYLGEIDYLPNSMGYDGMHTVGCKNAVKNLSNDLVIQMSTGLTDKNGRDIYESDIVITNKNHEAYFLNKSLPDYTGGYICYLCGQFNVCQKYIGRTPITDFATCHCCGCALEIIGNLLETPELLG